VKEKLVGMLANSENSLVLLSAYLRKKRLADFLWKELYMEFH
jgi:hypothetical protein